MKDKTTLKWIYNQSKNQFFSIFLLIIGNAAFAVTGVVFALASRGVVDSATSGNLSQLIRHSLILLAIMLCQLMLRVACNYISVRVQARLEIQYKNHILKKIFGRDYMHISAYHSGEVLNRITSDVNVVRDAVTNILPNVVGLITRLALAFTILCFMDKTFAIVFGIAGISLLLIKNLFRNWLKEMHKKMQAADGQVRSFIQEIVSNLLVVKVFGVEKKMADKANDLQQEHYRIRMKRTSVSILANSSISFFFSLGYLYALTWSAYRLYLESITFGTLTAILQLINQVQTPFSSLSGLLPQYYSMIASTERIMELEQLPEESIAQDTLYDGQELYNNMLSIEFDSLDFRYSDNSPLVFDKANLSIQKGEFIAIGGLSGIGKSTLLKLLLGVLTPQGGSISIKNKDGSRIVTDRMTRPMFAYVPQGSIILSGSIRDNIIFMNDDITEELIQQAIDLSCSREFIDALPDGLDTVIGEKGHGLSEGQLQRLAIARALVGNAPVILLDESTSALDENTESQVLTNLRNLDNKTLIIISHKKAAFQICNRIIRIKNGEILSNE